VKRRRDECGRIVPTVSPQARLSGKGIYPHGVFFALGSHVALGVLIIIMSLSIEAILIGVVRHGSAPILKKRSLGHEPAAWPSKTATRGEE